MTPQRPQKPLWKPSLFMGLILTALLISGFDQPAVRIEPANPAIPRPVEKQTEAAVVRDYLQAWQSLGKALEQNQVDLLDANFVGVAKEKLADSIREQQKLGMQTRYRDRSHDLAVVFYSPEGLSIQLRDTVEYDEEIVDHGEVQASQRVRSRYVAVLTPTEVRWKVRLFQAETE
jgi:hypothetical protein